MAGKFSAKNREHAVDVRTILAEREQAQQRRSGAPAAPQKRKPAQPAEPAKPRSQKNARSTKKAVKGPRLGGVIFYTIFLLFIFLFYIATYFGLLELRDWLNRYEMAQPTTKSQEIFATLFSDPDWGSLYDIANVQDAAYETKESFIGYMQNTVGETDLTYAETSTGLSNDKKYIVRLGDQKIAAFTLVNHNQSESQTEIADWRLGTLEFFVQYNESYYIKKLDGHTVYVNGSPLDDSFTVRINTTNAEPYLPEGLTGIRVCTQYITELAGKPNVRILDAAGNEMNVVYDESTHTFAEQFDVAAITDAQQDLAVNAVKTYALYMIRRAGEGDIAEYFLRGSDAYKAITDTELAFVQDAVSREFVNEAVTNYRCYSDSLFSARVSVTLNQYRANGSVKDSTIEQSLFFEKQSNGKWKCYAMTAVDVFQPVEKVLLTFMNEGAVLASDFYDCEINTLTCPVVAAPEGKVFSGWMVEETDENGQTVMNIIFQPDENGFVTMPAGATLEPMTLYPYFEEINESLT